MVPYKVRGMLSRISTISKVLVFLAGSSGFLNGVLLLIQSDFVLHTFQQLNLQLGTQINKKYEDVGYLLANFRYVCFGESLRFFYSLPKEMFEKFSSLNRDSLCKVGLTTRS